MFGRTGRRSCAAERQKSGVRSQESGEFILHTSAFLSMRVLLSGRFSKFVAVPGAAAALAVGAFWILSTYLAERAGHRPALSRLEPAARLHPNNSAHPLPPGRLYAYDPSDP